MACHLWGATPLSEPMLAYCLLDPWEQISVKLISKYNNTHSWKSIWKCPLPFCLSLHVLNFCLIYYISNLIPLAAYIWGLWHQKQVPQAWISNCVQQNTVECNYFYLPEIPASGTKVLIHSKLDTCSMVFQTWCGHIVFNSTIDSQYIVVNITW